MALSYWLKFISCHRMSDVEHAPHHFRCPLAQTGELMVDPVVASDGVNYERIAIEVMTQKHSPPVLPCCAATPLAYLVTL